jgi:hypothetical protein
MGMPHGQGGTMEYSDSHRRHTAGSGRSGRVALNPCCFEDVGLTPGELDRFRAADTRIITPR